MDVWAGVWTGACGPGRVDRGVWTGGCLRRPTSEATAKRVRSSVATGWPARRPRPSRRSPRSAWLAGRGRAGLHDPLEDRAACRAGERVPLRPEPGRASKAAARSARYDEVLDVVEQRPGAVRLGDLDGAQARRAAAAPRHRAGRSAPCSCGPRPSAACAARTTACCARRRACRPCCRPSRRRTPPRPTPRSPTLGRPVDGLPADEPDARARARGSRRAMPATARGSRRARARGRRVRPSSVRSPSTVRAAEAVGVHDVLQAHLAAGDEPVGLVPDLDQPELLQATAVHGLGDGPQRALADRPQEVRRVVHADDLTAVAEPDGARRCWRRSRPRTRTRRRARCRRAGAATGVTSQLMTTRSGPTSSNRRPRSSTNPPAVRCGRPASAPSWGQGSEAEDRTRRRRRCHCARVTIGRTTDKMHTSGPGRPHYGATRRRAGRGASDSDRTGVLAVGCSKRAPARGRSMRRRRHSPGAASVEYGLLIALVAGAICFGVGYSLQGHDPGALLLADQPGVAVLVGLRPGHGAVIPGGSGDSGGGGAVAGAAADRPPRRRTRRRPRPPRRRRPPRPRRTPPRPERHRSGIGAASPVEVLLDEALLKTPPRVELGGQAAASARRGYRPRTVAAGTVNTLPQCGRAPNGASAASTARTAGSAAAMSPDPGEVERDASPARTPG